MKQSTKGLIMVLISGLVFGCVPGVVSFCYSQGARPELFVFSRYFALTLVLLPFMIRKKGLFQLYKRHFWLFLGLSALSIATPLLLYIVYQFLATSIATTIHFLYPALVAVISVVFLKEKLSKLRLISVILCGAGILLIMEFGGKITLPGILMAAASAVTWASYIILLSRLKDPEVKSEHVLFFLAVNCLAMITLVVLVDGALVDCIRHMSGLGWLATALMGLGTAVFGVGFFAIGVRKTDAQIAAIASTLEPITCIAVGVLFLGETFTVRTAIGSVLILTAVVLLTLPEKKTKEPETPAAETETDAEAPTS